MEGARLVAAVAVIGAVVGIVLAGCTSAADRSLDLASSNRVWDGGSAVALAPQPG